MRNTRKVNLPINIDNNYHSQLYERDDYIFKCTAKLCNTNLTAYASQDVRNYFARFIIVTICIPRAISSLGAQNFRDYSAGKQTRFGNASNVFSRLHTARAVVSRNRSTRASVLPRTLANELFYVSRYLQVFRKRLRRAENTRLVQLFEVKGRR